MGLVADITRLMKQRDEARAELQRLQVRNVDLVDQVKYLLQRLQQAGVTLNEAEGVSGER